MAFWGYSENTIDTANRLIVPMRFRAGLGESVAIYRAPEGCLFLYSEEEISRVVEHLETNSNSLTGRDANREFFDSICVVPVDRNFRIVIPAECMEYAGLGSEVALLGVKRYVELWDRETYQKRKASWSERPLSETLDVYL